MKKYYPDVKFDHPKEPFLSRLVKEGFPLQQARWCCKIYKEQGGMGRFLITGIRWEESSRRKKRKMIENCLRGGNKRFLNVIIDWTEKEIWEFIRKFNLPYCELYDKGWRRIGCLFCPFSSVKMRMLMTKQYPHQTRLFIKAFEQLYQNRKAKHLKSINRWKNGEDMFWWWIKGKISNNIKQPMLFE